jgi:hypothetical protein
MAPAVRTTSVLDTVLALAAAIIGLAAAATTVYVWQL